MTATASRSGVFPADARSAAELYIAQGKAPIPLPTRSKDPGFEDWPRLRMTLDDLDQYFPAGQDRNLGILNGAPSTNQADVDLDCDEARHAALTLLPATGWRFGRASAPRSHWVYETNTALDKSEIKFKDIDGKCLAELRGTGGHTLFPPSLHPDGERITWEMHTEPAKVPLADLQRIVAQVAAAALIARHWPRTGSRQDASLALAGGLARAGWDVEQIERFLLAVVQAGDDEEPNRRRTVVEGTVEKLKAGAKLRGWPSLAKIVGNEVVQCVREWLGLEQRKPAPKKARTLQPYQPFPVAELPQPLDEYVQQGALALGCDCSFLALPVLAAAAAVIGNTRTIRLKRGWEEPSVIWSAIVGDSGTLKSPAYLKAVAHLFRLQRQLLQEFKEKKTRYEEDLAEYMAAKRQAKKDKTDPGDPPEEPLLQRVVCSDTTIEKLALILEDNPRGTLVARDELAGWLGSFTRYKAQGGTDLPNWLEMFRAGTIVVDRKTSERQTLFIHRAAVSITGGIQPGVLARALTPEFLDAGLPARVLMAMPPKLAKCWTEAEVAPETEAAYHLALDRLRALNFQTKDGEKIPHALSLSPEAKELWVTFYNGWAKEQAAVEGDIAAAYSKLEAYAARLALIHHVVTHVTLESTDLRPVGVRSVEAGITLARWFAYEARRIYSTLSESNEERETRRLVEFIQARGGRISVRGLMRANCRRYPDAEIAEGALTALVEAGLARWIEPLTSMKGGKPIKVIELCMTHDTDDTDPGGEDDDGPPAHDNGDDTDPRPTPGSSEFPRKTEDTESGVIGVMRHAQEKGTEPGGEGVGDRCHTQDSRNGTGVIHTQTDPKAAGTSAPAYLLVQDQAELQVVVAALDETALVGLDLETTGLDPRTDRVRLLSLACDTIDCGTFSYLVDVFAVDPAPLWEALAEKELVIHNAAFDLSFLTRLGFTPDGAVHDTMLLAQLLVAGTYDKVSLAACSERYLGRTLDKAEQVSDWSGPLTDDQLAYAALDVEVLGPLYHILSQQIQEAGLVEAASIERRCQPAVTWMARQGVAFDRYTWKALAQNATAEADRLRRELDQAAPPQPGELYDSWNWDSPPQAQQALSLVGCTVEDTADETLAALDHPFANLLRQYRVASKKVTTYGTDWLQHVSDDGRVYPGWRQNGTRSGRMSCRNPNLQQLPRGEYRRCVVAPHGRVLVKADYSQIELRIAAKVSGDRALLEAYQRGDDLHTLTARNVLGIQEVTKQHRQLAKALNFGLLYGMGVDGFRQYAKSQYGQHLTEEEARTYRSAFFRTYPGLARWHRQTGRSGKNAIETRTLVGRRRLDVGRFTEKLNTPVQGTGADGLKLALALLWERRGVVPGAFPVLAVHDEIVVECDANQADAVAAWLKAVMVEAMQPLIEPVPVEVEVKVARTWGGE